MTVSHGDMSKKVSRRCTYIVENVFKSRSLTPATGEIYKLKTKDNHHYITAVRIGDLSLAHATTKIRGQKK